MGGNDGGSGGNVAGTVAGKSGSPSVALSRPGLRGDRVPTLPRPWVQRLELPTSAALQCYVGGSRTFNYRDYTVTMHTYGSTSDLCVLRATDTATQDDHVWYGPREDRLVRRSSYAVSNSVLEWFTPGRRREGALESLRLHAYTPASSREFWFYVDGRLDGLILRKEVLSASTAVPSRKGGRVADVRLKTKEYFHGRSDRLVYRSAKYSTGGARDTPLKVSVRYSRNPAVPSHEDVEWIKYVGPGTTSGHVAVLFHHAPQSISRPSHVYKRTQTVDVVHDPFLPEPTPAMLVARMKELFISEKAVLSDLRDADVDAAAILRTRAQEDAQVTASYSIFAPLVDPAAITRATEEDRAKDAKDRARDPFARFIQQVIAARTVASADEALTRDEALAVYNAAVVDFKRRSQRRAQIMAKRLEDERAALQRRQVAFQRAQDTDAAQETDAFHAFVEKAVWKIHLVETRIDRHEQESSTRFAKLEQQLRDDPRIGPWLSEASQ